MKVLLRWAAVVCLRGAVMVTVITPLGSAPACAGPAVEAGATAPHAVLVFAGQGQSVDQGPSQEDERFWASLLNRTGWSWKRAATLDKVTARPGTVLVIGLDGAVPSPQEWRALARLRRAGVPMLVSGRPAAHAAANVLQRLLGLPMQALQVSDDLHVASIGQTPLTASLPAGTRVLSQPGPFWIPRQPGPWRAAAEFTDWSYRPPESGAAPAVLYGQRPGQPWVYFAAEQHDLEPDEVDAVSRLLRASLDWLSRARPPAIHLADWPAGFRSAQLVEMDTELDDRKDARMLDAALQLGEWVAAVGGQASFYCVTGDLALRPALLDVLAAQGHDLGLHGERHDPFGGVPADEQAQRLRAMWAQWRGLRNDTVTAATTGFRAPYESFDAVTERALADLGMGYHVSDAPSAPHRLPYFVDLGEGRRLLRLPRTQPDDYRFSEEQLDTPAVKRLLRVDAQSAARLGALGLLSVHPQYFTEGSPVRRVLPEWLASLPRGPGGVWLTSGARIAAWWQRRERLHWQPTSHGMQLDVPTAPADEAWTFIVDADLHDRVVRSSDTRRLTVVSVRPWPDDRAPVWQTAVTVRLHAPGPAQLTWAASALTPISLR